MRARIEAKHGRELEVILKLLTFKQKTAYEMIEGDWSSDVCSSDLFLGEVISFIDRESL